MSILHIRNNPCGITCSFQKGCQIKKNTQRNKFTKIRYYCTYELSICNIKSVLKRSLHSSKGFKSHFTNIMKCCVVIPTLPIEKIKQTKTDAHLRFSKLKLWRCAKETDYKKPTCQDVPLLGPTIALASSVMQPNMHNIEGIFISLECIFIFLTFEQQTAVYATLTKKDGSFPGWQQV